MKQLSDMPRPEQAGWIEWNGGANPCPPGAVVEWQTRAMPGRIQALGPREAGVLDWTHYCSGDDIVAFRIVGDIKMRDQRMTASEALRRYSEPMLPRESEESILREAERIVHGDRAVDYGEIKEAYASIAGMWSIIIGARVTPRDVARCMIALKLTRDCNRAKRDNAVDIAGYAHVMHNLEDVP